MTHYVTGSTGIGGCVQDINLNNRKEVNMEITEKGLKLISIAFEQLNSGVSGRDALELLCLNAGCESIGEVGEVTEYNPLQHEDSEGGIAPGEMIKVVHAGMLNPDAVRRTVVKVSHDGVNVEEQVHEQPFKQVVARAIVQRA